MTWPTTRFAGIVLRRSAVALLAPFLVLGLAACATTGRPANAAVFTDQGPADEVRIGYFANVTHAPALVADVEGYFADALGDDTTITFTTFNAGPAAIEALRGGSIDIAYLGPNPAITGYVTTNGSLLRIIAGAASGGAQLVVAPSITDVADLAGTQIATPQRGGTQDVAARAYLAKHGLSTDLRGGGDVDLVPTTNAQTLQLFTDGQIDGAWLPEPWASRLVLEAGAHVLVDEADLWPDGDFVTTTIVATQEFLGEHPDTVRAVLEAHVKAVDWIDEHPDDAAVVINDALAEKAGKALRADVLARSLSSLTFTVDPLASTLDDLFTHGLDAGTTELPLGIPPDGVLDGIYDLRLLDAVLDAHGEPPVDSAGLGKE
ncbi:ABC transporter substrate-binding protein [Sanguibacter antarcticus]|uniref:NitT/TauT family transport system substrate-binding protein n=1 Tax=Sanguibacter antarcticus TaxID=372484 RepID=A0A2A9E6E1_9MICO|nr:ABC transporter substrate-binding protein [Sanguibacter antarcticus]PFG33905.1 NitT/TauT family transport system substrate-binding protein [Sanguibacter antarcticus]